MGTCEHCDNVGIVTIDGRLLCHGHALQAIAEKERGNVYDSSTAPMPGRRRDPPIAARTG
jgi:hypothetical protein